MIIAEHAQNSPEWFQARLGMPTASNFSSLITSDGTPSKSAQGYAETLAGELYAGQRLDSWQGNDYTQFGHDTEEEAALSYALQHDAELQPIGFCESDDRRYGCSPDRLVGDDGVVELKCFPKRHISMLLYWHKHKRTPPEFIAQTQGELLVTGRAYCDLFFYSPVLPTLVIRQEPIPAIQDALLVQIEKCIQERDRVLEILRGM